MANHFIDCTQIAPLEHKYVYNEFNKNIFTKILCPKILLKLATIDKGSRHPYIQYRKRLQYSVYSIM